MDSVALHEQLNVLVNSMYAEGLLDDQFGQLQMLQDSSNPGFIAEVITLFCDDSHRILTELTKLIDQPVVDFQKVDAYVHQMKGSSSSVGAQNVKLACIQFRQFCEENNKEGIPAALIRSPHTNWEQEHGSISLLNVQEAGGLGSICQRALDVVKHEYYRLRNKFETMVQLEQRIQSL